VSRPELAHGPRRASSQLKTRLSPWSDRERQGDYVNPHDRKARIRAYKETTPPAGVFRVRNIVTGKSLIGPTLNLPGMLNRQRFQLENGSHPDAELQGDWNELGPAAFEFEVLDRLEPKEGPARDPADDLSVLTEMWIERLTASGESLYQRSRRGI
jgi:hypothetical protein